jgi:excinuclease UvrABC helicase subunit UvrB
VNSVHHHPYQHHENVGSIYQQQYYHTSAINNHDLSNSTTTSTISDHDDVSSTTTTTTVIYNSTQPQIQPSASSAAIQRIKTDLKSQLSALPRRQQTFNEQNLSSQHVIQIPPVNMNDPRFDMKMSTIRYFYYPHFHNTLS